MTTAPSAKKIFISYRIEEPDLSLANTFYQDLKTAGHDVFMAGDSLRLGDHWPTVIKNELEQADYFVLLLSEKSASSDMVIGEVSRAKRLYDASPEDAKKPRILPIRVQLPFNASLNYDIRSYLERIQQVLWNGDQDTTKILQEIKYAISGQKSWILPETEAQLLTPAIETLDSPPLPVAEPELPEGQKIFISYRNQEPDLSLANTVCQDLKTAGHDVFMAGESLQPGDHWPTVIKDNLEQVDYFILLLSEKSASSKMVIGEVKRARKFYDASPKAAKKPRIIPIRVQLTFDVDINYDIDSYLEGIQQVPWNGDQDTAQLLQIIKAVISRQKSKTFPKVEAQPSTPAIETLDSPPLPVAKPEMPGGTIKDNSLFYIERPYQNSTIEQVAYRAIEQPGSLIIIKAPQQMGKTSLILKILNHARKQGDTTIHLRLQPVNEKILSDLGVFLRWLCAIVGQNSKLPNKINDYWDDEFFDANTNCNNYFEEYLLPNISGSLTLVIDDFNCLFTFEACAREVVGLLRAWHEQARANEVWQKLKLIITHTAEVHIHSDLNQSPLNVGLQLQLTNFQLPQVQDLARRHGLQLSDQDLQSLIDMVNGHPYLVRVALYHIHDTSISMQQFLRDCHMETGGYGEHLRSKLWLLENHPELKAGMRRLIASKFPIRLEIPVTAKLEGLGLVKRDGDKTVISCQLYQKYFHNRLIKD